MSRKIKIKVGVISHSGRLRLLTVTETLISLDITKTESTVIVVLLYLEGKKWKSCFTIFTIFFMIIN